MGILFNKYGKLNHELVGCILKEMYEKREKNKPSLTKRLSKGKINPSNTNDKDISNEGILESLKKDETQIKMVTMLETILNNTIKQEKQMQNIKNDFLQTLTEHTETIVDAISEVNANVKDIANQISDLNDEKYEKMKENIKQDLNAMYKPFYERVN